MQGAKRTAIRCNLCRSASLMGAFRSEGDRQAILDAGADAAIDLSGTDMREAVRSQVLAGTDGRGADVVLDPIGGEFLSSALRATAWSGRLAVIGFAAGEIPTVRVNYLLLKNIGILGLDISQYRQRAPDRLMAAQAELFDLWRQGLLEPRVARQFRFEDIPEALSFVAGGKTRGRAIIAAKSRVVYGVATER